MKNISPNSNDRLRILLGRAADTTEQLMQKVSNPATREALQRKLVVTREKIANLSGVSA